MIEEELKNLRLVFSSAPRFQKYVWMDEFAVFVGTSRVKKALEESFKAHRDSSGSNAAFIPCIKAVDALEEQIVRGIMHFVGKVLVPRIEFDEMLKALELSCRALDGGLATARDVPLTPEEISDNARAEAAAKQRALDLVVGKSRPKSIGPWGS